MSTSQSTCGTLLSTGLIRSGLLSILDPMDGNVSAAAFAELNFMLDAWSSELGPLYNIVDSQYQATNAGFTLVGSQQQYVLGTNPGNLLQVRPTKIHDIFLVDGNGVSYYQQKIYFDEWTRLIYKGVGPGTGAGGAPGRPDRVWEDYQETTVTLNFYPNPAYTDAVHVMYPAALSQFVTQADAVIFPPGYQDVFINALAIRLANYFGKQPPPYVVQQYDYGKRVLKTNNEFLYLLQNPMPTQKRRFFNILTGGTV
jgi:hypothetical protein